MGVRQKDLEYAEALFFNQAKEHDWKWMLVPTPIKALEGPKKRAEFVKAVIDSRVELFHKEWKDAAADARLLSETGGVAMVSVMTAKPPRCNILDMFINGSSQKRKGK